MSSYGQTIFLSDDLITIIVLSISLFVFIVGTIGIFLYDLSISKKAKDTIKHRYNMSQNLRIDFNKREVRIISLKSLGKMKVLTFEQFLSSFIGDNQKAMQNWIEDLLDGSIDPDLDENMVKVADLLVRTNKKRNVRRMVFLCNHIDKENKVLFFESEILLNISPDINNKNKSDKRNLVKYKYDTDDIKARFDKGQFNRGSIFIIRLIQKENTFASYNTKFLKIIILDAISKVLNKNSTYFYFTNNELELCLIDDKTSTQYALMKVINVIKEHISETLEIRGYQNYFDYYIVSSLINDLEKGYDASYSNLSKFFTIDINDARKYYVYKKDKGNHYDYEQSYKSELNRLIRGQYLDVQFRPLIHIANKRVINMGYMSFVKPQNTMFKDFDEIKKYAKMYELDKDVFSLMIRKIIPTFVNEKDNVSQKLALKISVDQIGYAVRSIPHFQGISSTSLILCFESKELIDIEDEPEFIRGIKNLKDKGYEVGLYLTANDYVLKRNTYSLFNYFFFNPQWSNNVKVNSSEYLKSHQYLEKLVTYNATIIGVGLQNLQSIELLVRTGLEYFSADCISQSSPMLLPLDKKISKKLLNMKK